MRMIEGLSKLFCGVSNLGPIDKSYSKNGKWVPTAQPIRPLNTEYHPDNRQLRRSNSRQQMGVEESKMQESKWIPDFINTRSLSRCEF